MRPSVIVGGREDSAWMDNVVPVRYQGQDWGVGLIARNAIARGRPLEPVMGVRACTCNEYMRICFYRDFRRKI